MKVIFCKIDKVGPIKIFQGHYITVKTYVLCMEKVFKTDEKYDKNIIAIWVFAFYYTSLPLSVYELFWLCFVSKGSFLKCL